MIYGVMDNRTHEFRFVTAGTSGAGPCAPVGSTGPANKRYSRGAAAKMPAMRSDRCNSNGEIGCTSPRTTHGGGNPAGQEFGAVKLLEAYGQNRNRPLDESLSEVIARVESGVLPRGPPTTWPCSQLIAIGASARSGSQRKNSGESAVSILPMIGKCHSVPETRPDPGKRKAPHPPFRGLSL